MEVGHGGCAAGRVRVHPAMNRETRIRRINRWLKIRDWIDNKLSELHGASTKCPNCNVWSYQLPLDKQPQWSEGPPATMTDIRTCQHCGNVSQWFDTGFMGVMTCVEVNYKPPLAEAS